MAGGELSSTLVLFDVDGTLTEPRRVVQQDILEALKKLSAKTKVGLVGGSDLDKIAWQMGHTTESIKYAFDYVFSENGLVSFQRDPKSPSGYKDLPPASFVDHIGEEMLQRLINSSLSLISKTTLPCKRGTFVEFRRGMLNVSPIGRTCSQAERDQFYEYDKIHGVRKHMVSALEEEFSQHNIKFSIGGQISLDVFPVGWDKTYCLQFVEGEFTEIHFLGDKTFEGGNDFEIFSDSRTIGHTVTSPADTIQIIDKILSQ